MKYRFLLPGVYILLMLLFLIRLVWTAGGHGWNPFEFALNLTYPARFLLKLFPAPSGPPRLWPVFLRLVFAGLLQWALIGYLVDKVLARKKASLEPI
jgi:hypothetical protein